MRTLINFFKLFNNSIKRQFIIILFEIIISSIIETLSIGLIIPLLIVILQNDIFQKYPILSNWLPSLVGMPKEFILKITIVSFFILFSIKSALVTYFNWHQISFSSKIQTILSSRLYSMYLKLPYYFHLEKNSSIILNNFNIEIPQIQGAVNSILNLLSEIFIILMICFLLISYQPVGTTLVLLIFFLISIIYTFFSNKYFKKWSEIRQLQYNNSTQNLMQGLGSIKVVKLLGREENFISSFSKSQKEVHKITKLYNFSGIIPRQIMEYLSMVCLLFLISFMITYKATNDEILYTIGLFAMSAFRLIPSITRLITYVQSLKFSIVSIENITNELRYEKNCETYNFNEHSKNDSFFEKSITINNLTYIYPNTDKTILKNINIEIKKGQMIGIIGETGSGKTTLIDLIIGLLDSTSGEIKIDNEFLTRTNKNIWQKKIGYVPQNIYLIDDSIKKNIAIGVEEHEINENMIRESLRLAQLDKYIESLPENINTTVGERGVRISGGQRQRIGIARALYNNPSVLVLDEATSALDTNTESEIMAAVSKLQNKTIFIIAHRYSTLNNCDFIIKLVNGTISQILKPNEINK